MNVASRIRYFVILLVLVMITFLVAPFFPFLKMIVLVVDQFELVTLLVSDSIGKETFDNLGRLFKKGFSIGEAYEKCKNKVPFETVETCYLLLN